MKLRRILTVFVAVLLISLAAVVTASADEGQFEIAVGVSSSTAILQDEQYNVVPGDEIDLTVSITENPGIDSFQLNIKFDPTLVTPVLDPDGNIVVIGELLPGLNVEMKNSGDEIVFVRYSSVNGTSTTNATGKATVKFKVLDVTCEEIKFERSTLSALKSIQTFPFTKELASAANKADIDSTFASTVFMAHDYKLVDTTAPTCTEYGVEHYACDCGSTRDLVGAEPTEHTPVTEEDKKTSCSEPGYFGATVCSACNTVLVERVEIPTIAHSVTTVPGKAPTCTETGLSDGKQCSVCKTWIEEQEEIPTVDHTPVDVEGKAATCTTDGATDGKKCSVCDAVLVAQEVIPAAHGEIIEDDDGNKVCSVCDVIIEAKEEETTEAPTEEKTTEAPKTEPQTDGEDKGKGCGSAIGISAIAIILTSLACAPIFKKKED